MSNDKLQKILNIILVILLIIISLFFIFSLLKVEGILQLLDNSGMDVLAFAGAIIGGLIGGIITFLGVKLTINHEKNMREEEKKENCIKLTSKVIIDILPYC